MHGQAGRLFQQEGKSVLVDDLYRDLRLRGHTLTVGRQFKREHLPGGEAAVCQDGLAIGKKAAAVEFHGPGQLGGNGTAAQKIAQQHAIRLRRHREIQSHPARPFPSSKIKIVYQNSASLANLVFLWYYRERKTSGTYGGGAALTALRKVRASQSTVTANGSRG